MKLPAAVCLLLLAHAGAASAKDINILSPFTALPSPAAEGSLAPSLFGTATGDVNMSWVERGPDESYQLRISTLEGNAWSEPRTLLSGNGWVVNGVNVPTVVAANNGFMAASWLESVGEHHAMRVRIAQSFDAGKTWGEPLTPHRDNTPTEHGFVSMVPTPGGLFAIWLDGRKYAGEDPARETAVRFARIDRNGKLHDEAELDGRACDCCPTSMTRFGKDIVAVYRDRGTDELRDINALTYHGGAWGEPETVHHDGWRVAACPVNGPAVDAVPDMLAVAWFSGADDGSVNFARGIGARAVRVDDGHPLGRVDVVAMSHGAAVSWVEAVDDGAQIRVRYVGAEVKQSYRVADTGASWASGIPRIIRARGQLLAAWTDGDAGVKTARVDIARLMGVER